MQCPTLNIRRDRLQTSRSQLVDEGRRGVLFGVCVCVVAAVGWLDGGGGVTFWLAAGWRWLSDGSVNIGWRRAGKLTYVSFLLLTNPEAPSLGMATSKRGESPVCRQQWGHDQRRADRECV